MRAVRRLTAAGAVAAAFAALTPLVAGGAAASDCSTSWNLPVDGDWHEPLNWSGGVPDSTTDACIVATGAFTVTLNGAGAAHSLTLGTDEGSTTLRIVGAADAPAGLTVGGAVAIAETGAVVLTSSGSSGDATLDAGANAISNQGAITAAAGDGGTRMLRGALTNTGAVTIAQATSFDGTWLNQGTLTVGGATLTVAGGSFTNGTGGAVGGNGTLAVDDAALTHAAGTIEATTNVLLTDSDLTLAGTNAGTFVWHGSGALSGDVSPGQMLRLEGTAAADALAVAAGNLANSGEIVLTSTAAAAATVDVGSNMFSNQGTVTISPGGGGGRTLRGNVTNDGTVAVNAAATFDGTGATWLNDGPLNIAAAAALTLPGGQTFTNAGGGLNFGGTGAPGLSLVGSTFVHGAGTITGSRQIELTDSDLSLTSTGPASFLWHGDGEVSGAIAAGQSIDVEATAGDAVLRPLADSNAGAIKLTSTGGGAAVIDRGADTLVNSGTITATGSSGTRVVRGNLSTTGTVKVLTDLIFENAGNGTWNNQGTLEIADQKSLFVGDGETFRAGGTILQTGSDPDPFKKGTIDLTNADLVMAGATAGTFVWHGSGDFVGNVAKNQRIVVEGKPGTPAVLHTASNVTNSGAISLSAGGGGDGDATISMPGKTLTNKGEFRAAYGPDGGGRTLEGNLDNRKTVALELGLSIIGSYSQSSVATFLPFFWEPADWGRLTATGQVTLAGKIKYFRGIPAPGAGTFVPAPGSSFVLAQGSAVVGEFTTFLTPRITATDYFLAEYSPTQVTAVVKRARVTATPSTAAPGTTIALDGSEFPPGATVQISFKDKARAVTGPVQVVADPNGSFSLPFTIPSTAAVGKGSFTSSVVGGAFKGLKVTTVFTVT